VIAAPTLQELPGLAVLKWIDIPVLAMAKDGSIVFANQAFADMIGYTPEMVQVLTYRQIFGPTPEVGSPLAVMRASADLMVELAHLDGSVVQAKVSEPFLVGDEMALATFRDMTDQLWLEY
jgi:PAS domain-containing protein